RSCSAPRASGRDGPFTSGADSPAAGAERRSSGASRIFAAHTGVRNVSHKNSQAAEAHIALIEADVRLPLAHFTLDVHFASDAKVTALVGPSGSGKTSFVESIAGLRQATGRVAVGESSLNDLPPERRRIGYVPQDAALFPHLSVHDNIRFGGEDGTRFESLCATLELTPLLGRSPSTLSGGERQRVAIARALMTNPRLLLLEQPL